MQASALVSFLRTQDRLLYSILSVPPGRPALETAESLKELASLQGTLIAGDPQQRVLMNVRVQEAAVRVLAKSVKSYAA